LPEIARLTEQDKYFAAFSLARKAEKYIGNDSALASLWPEMSRDCSITSRPAGAEIFFGEYSRGETAWEHLGRSALEKIRIPFGSYRWRVEKEGFGTSETVRFVTPSVHWGWPAARPIGKIHFSLREEGSLGAGMVWVAPAELITPRISVLHPCSISDLPAYAIDRYDVTNRQVKGFVDGGGYRNAEYWRGLRFVKEGGELSWGQAMAEFRDSTGRPGPSTWEGGTFGEGRGAYPVGGVSWFEASAYARFAGKRLPTIYHWAEAAITEEDEASRIIPFSNFGEGPAPVGRNRGMGHFGLYDAAGNVREWCHNAADDSESRRYILGGAWNESTYMFTSGDARSPWDRDAGNGLRCAQYGGGEEAVPEAAFVPVTRKVRELAAFEPVSDETFRSYIESLYHYDRTELHAVVEGIDESPEYWRREKITFDAAYPDERVTAYLLVPKGVAAPYQTIVFFPGGGVRDERSSESLRDEPEISFLIKSGRSMLYPVYKGTYERADSVTGGLSRKQDTVLFRDWIVQMSKDMRRSIDYLETREDIDRARLAYVGLSWGSLFGPIMLATENRFKVAVFLKGGICPCQRLPAADPANFAGRVKIPVLMISGQHDYIFPYETGQKPFFDLLGTPDDEKKHIVYPGGHSLTWENRKKYQEDVLDWLDSHLGEVNYKP
jgi:pimeloyl-ACP methyl ester carboxylesterase